MNPPLQLTDAKRPQYYIRVREIGPDGKARQTRKYLTYFDEGKRKAEQAKREYLDGLATTNTRNRDGRNLTFTQFVDLHFRRKRNIKNSTRLAYEYVLDEYLVPFFGTKALDAIKLHDLLQYADTHENVLASSTIHYHLGILRSIFKMAERLECIQRNPCLFLADELGQKTYKRERRLLADDQLRTTFDKADPQLRLIIEIAAMTGLRISEILGLRHQDIHLDQRFITPSVRFYRGEMDTLKTKASHEPRVIDTELCEAIRQWMADHPSLYLFPRDMDNTRPTASDVVRDRLRTIAKAAGFYYEGFGFHAFRRLFITRIQQVGATSIETANWAGHADEGTTKHYTLPDLERRQTLAAALGNRLRKSVESVPPKAANA